MLRQGKPRKISRVCASSAITLTASSLTACTMLVPTWLNDVKPLNITPIIDSTQRFFLDSFCCSYGYASASPPVRLPTCLDLFEWMCSHLSIFCFVLQVVILQSNYWPSLIFLTMLLTLLVTTSTFGLYTQLCIIII